jgi:hypothetical protein
MREQRQVDVRQCLFGNRMGAVDGKGELEVEGSYSNHAPRNTGETETGAIGYRSAPDTRKILRQSSRRQS